MIMEHVQRIMAQVGTYEGDIARKIMAAKTVLLGE